MTVLDSVDVRPEKADVHTLVEDHLALAHKIAYDYLARAPRHTDRDDVVSGALLGLVQAAARFDGSKGVPFVAWARQRIYGGVVDAARGNDPLPRRTRDNVNVLRAAADQLTRDGQDATDLAIAEKTGLPLDRVRKLRADLHAGVMVSLDETFPTREDNFALQLVDADPTPLESLEKRELDAALVGAVSGLPERMREVIEAHFVRGESNGEIAGRLGVTPQRVSQLRMEALRKLRGVLDADEPSLQPSRPVTAAVSLAASMHARRMYAAQLNA